MMDTFTIKRNDTSPAIQKSLVDFAGAVNLTGATVMFKMVDTENAPKVNSAAEIVAPATDGVVRYLWEEGDTDTAGIFFAEFTVTFADGTEGTFPNAEYIKITVTRDL